MQITEITVSAGRTFNHPYESYSNLRPNLTLTATLDPGEDALQAIRTLQGQAEEVVEEHKQAMFASIEQLQRMTQREHDIARLLRLIAEEQRKLDLLRSAIASEGQQVAMPQLLTRAGHEQEEACDEEAGHAF